MRYGQNSKENRTRPTYLRQSRRTRAFEGRRTTTSRVQKKKWIHLDWKTYQTLRRKETMLG